MATFTKNTMPDIEIYKNELPLMDVKAFFNGRLAAQGLVQDWRGKVVSRFDVAMHGSWQGDTGTLIEDFTYYSGETQHREWTLQLLPDGRIEGTAADIIGKATGQVCGNAMNLHYLMDVETQGRKIRLKFDDWMWLMRGDTVINRVALKKFGLPVATLTIFMQKSP